MRKIFIFAYFTLISVLAFSQTSLNYELGKTGILHNIAFDHRLNKSNFGVRAFTGSNFGMRAFTGAGFGVFNVAIQLGGGGYYLVGKTKFFLETGVDLAWFRHDATEEDQGISLVYPERNLSTLYASANIGYRYSGRRMIFRVGVSPGIIQSEVIPGGYLGFGFRIR